ncbi:hypothetical protein ACSBR1_030001 [Camellia fascicularis]
MDIRVSSLSERFWKRTLGVTILPSSPRDVRAVPVVLRAATGILPVPMITITFLVIQVEIGIVRGRTHRIPTHLPLPPPLPYTLGIHPLPTVIGIHQRPAAFKFETRN